MKEENKNIENSKVNSSGDNLSELGSKPGDANSDTKTKLHVQYKRVSSLTQREDRQLTVEGVNWVITDKISGAIPFFDRPGGEELKKLVDEKKVEKISIWSIDRSARNMLDLLNFLKYMTDRKVCVQFVSQGLRTLDENNKQNPIANMVISILGVIADMQLNQIHEAQAQGIALAKSRGVYKGRVQNSKESVLQFLNKPKNVKALELLNKNYKGSEVAKIVGLSPTTVSKIKRFGLLNK